MILCKKELPDIAVSVDKIGNSPFGTNTVLGIVRNIHEGDQLCIEIVLASGGDFAYHDDIDNRIDPSKSSRTPRAGMYAVKLCNAQIIFRGSRTSAWPPQSEVFFGPEKGVELSKREKIASRIAASALGLVLSDPKGAIASKTMIISSEDLRTTMENQRPSIQLYGSHC